MKITFKYFVLLITLVIFHSITLSQTNTKFNQTTPLIPFQKNFVKGGDVFGTRVFIENKGQFDSKSINGEKIIYGIDNGYERIYFTCKGLIYEQIKTYALSERQREKMERGEDVNFKTEDHAYVSMTWEGSNGNNIKPTALEKQNHYFTYGGSEMNANAYKKLVYKNVYQNIDVEYTFPKDKDHGIKYSFVVHPGGDVAKIKMHYSGDIKKIKRNASGEIVISTAIDNITEHIPYCFQNISNEIQSQFKLSEDTISFNLLEPYMPSEDLIIDPWVTTLSTMASNSCAFDVDYDFGGNAFVYGGNLPPKVAMYNALGALQWTFGGSVTSISWVSNPNATSYASNFGINKFNSKTFIGQGYNGTGAQVIRLDANGNYDNFVSTANAQYREVWEMGFHCITADVFILGGGTSSNISAATINTVNSSLNLSTFQPTNNAIGQDIISHAIDDQGNIFVNYAGNTLNNKICRVTQSFTNNVWTQPSTFTTFSELTNKSMYPTASIYSNGFNALAVNANYLYYYDGLNLASYDKTTGTLVATTAIPGHSAREQGGIAVDDCDNIYIGSNNGSIKTYTFNGTSFSTLTPILLNVNLTNQYVWDIKLNRNTKTLFVCGSGFVGTYSAVPSATCPVPLGLCVFNSAGVAVSSSSITCATLGSATVSANGGTGTYSYTWIPSAQTGSVGTNLMPGTYTILVYDVGSSTNYTTTTTFISPTPLTGTVANTFMVNCNGAGNGTAAVTNLAGGSGNQTYTWTNGTLSQSTSSVSGLFAGNYTVTVKDALTSCVFSQSVNILGPLALNVLFFASSPTACVGSSITLNSLVSGGNPGYTYQWSGGPTTTSYVVSGSSGVNTYTLSALDAQNCPVTSALSVTFVPNPVLNVSNVSICPLETGTLNVSGATTYTWNGSATGSTFTDNPLSNQQYTVVGSALSCSSIATTNILIKSIPVPTLTSNSPVCNAQSLTLSAIGGTAFFWSGPQFFSTLSQSNSIANASPLNSGQYNVTVTAANSCTAPASINLTVHPTPTVSATGGTLCSNQILNLSSNSVPGASFYWTGPLGFSSISQNPSIINPAANLSGNFVVKATSAQGCTNTAIANVTVTTLPSAYPTSNAPLCFGSNLQLNGSNSFGGINYSWAGPNGFNSLLQNAVINPVSLAANGVYILTVFAGPCVTSASTSVLVYALPSPTASNNGPVCEKLNIGLNVTTPASNTITSYVWHGPHNFVANNSQTQINNTQLIHSGIYTVMVTDSHNCQNIGTTTVSILNNPTITALGDTVCLNQPATLKAFGGDTYKWYNSNANFSNLPVTIIANANNVAPSVYTVIGTALNTCTGTAIASIYTWALPQPSISVSPKSQGCLNTNFVLTGDGALYYNWTGPDNILYHGKTINIAATNMIFSGTYTLTGIDAHFCKTDVTTQLAVFDLPQGYLSNGITEACVPFTTEFVFSPNGGTSSLSAFSWNLDANTYTTTAFTKTFNKAGTYVLKANMLDINGCSNTTTVLINAWPQPVADFTYSPAKPIENLDVVEFINTSTSNNNITKWSWFFMPDLNTKKGFTSNKENTSYLFKEAGKYPVAFIIKNQNGCADSIVKVITVEEDFNVFVPNTFTPNDDGRNETFLAVTRGVKDYHLYVYDRWNELMFETTDPAVGWDGTFKGNACKQDVYVWKLIITSKRYDRKTYLGEVNLISK